MNTEFQKALAGKGKTEVQATFVLTCRKLEERKVFLTPPARKRFVELVKDRADDHRVSVVGVQIRYGVVYLKAPAIQIVELAGEVEARAREELGAWAELAVEDTTAPAYMDGMSASTKKVSAYAPLVR